MSLIVLYFLHITSVFSFYIDVVLTLSSSGITLPDVLFIVTTSPLDIESLKCYHTALQLPPTQPAISKPGGVLHQPDSVKNTWINITITLLTQLKMIYSLYYLVSRLKLTYGKCFIWCNYDMI